MSWSKQASPFVTYHDEVKFLNRALERLETEIQLLISRKIQYLRRLNQIHDATCILPNETLSIIFEYARSDSGPGLFPLFLGGVCSRWREVVWSCPKLWTTISVRAINSNTIPQIPSHCVDLLRLYFTNVAGLSMNIWLSPISTPPKIRIPLRDLVLLIFRDYPQKLRRLRLGSMTLELWRQIHDCVQPELLTNFTTIKFGRPNVMHSDHSISPFIAAPKLTKISAYADIEVAAFSWEKITSLKLTSVRLDKCLHLLIECPSLLEYQCITPSYLPSSRYDAHRRQTVTLSHLHTLKWQAFDDPWSRFLLTSIRFPVLRNLQLQCMPRTSRDVVSAGLRLLLDEFVHRLPCLKSFHGDVRLVWERPTQPDADPPLEVNGILLLRDLEELRLEGVDIRDLMFISDRLRIRDRPDTLDLLPKLRVLEFEARMGVFDGCMDDEVVRLFLDFLKTRQTRDDRKWSSCRPLESVRFSRRLRSQSDPFLYVEPEELEVIRGFIRDGLRIELVSTAGDTWSWS